jgi:hypothetical protein
MGNDQNREQESGPGENENAGIANNKIGNGHKDENEFESGITREVN